MDIKLYGFLLFIFGIVLIIASSPLNSDWLTTGGVISTVVGILTLKFVGVGNNGLSK